MEVAAATLGHLVRSGGAPTADIVETEVGQPPCAGCTPCQWSLTVRRQKTLMCIA